MTGEKERQYEDECGLDHGGRNSAGELCGRPAGWGTDFDSGKCKHHERHGEPRTGDKAELFRIAVSYGKHVHSEEWALDKPEDAKSGNAFVDKEEVQKPAGEGFKLTDVQYKQTVVQKGQQSLSQDRRMWLKDLGLLENNPDSQKADAVGDLATILSQE